MIKPDNSLSGSVDLSNEYRRKAYMLGSKTAWKRYEALNITVEDIIISAVTHLCFVVILCLKEYNRQKTLFVV